MQVDQLVDTVINSLLISSVIRVVGGVIGGVISIVVIIINGIAICGCCVCVHGFKVVFEGCINSGLKFTLTTCSCKVSRVVGTMRVCWRGHHHHHHHFHHCVCCHGCVLLFQLESDAGQGFLDNLSDLKFDYSAELCCCEFVKWGMAMVGGQHFCA